MDPLPVLQRSPLFSGLSPEALRDVATRLRPRNVRAGEVLFRAGEKGDSFFLVAAGRVRISVPAPRGEQVINQFGPGEWFGEMSLITGEPRSATAVAATDSTLATLSREDFQAILARNPSLAVPISHSLSHRLRVQTLARTRRPLPRSVAIVTTTDAPELDAILLELASALSEVGGRKLAIVDFAGGLEERARLPRAAVAIVAAEGANLTAVAADFCLVLLRIAAGDDADVAHLREADVVWVLEDGSGRAVQWLRGVEDVPHCLMLRLIGPERSITELTLASDPSVLRKAPIVRVDPRKTTARLLRGLARRVLGRRIGLALSAGGAKGLAHLGVLRCFERAGVEFDLVAGTSMGGIVGGLAAMGRTVDEMIAGFRDVRENFRRKLLDFGLPTTSILRGEKKRSLLREYAGDTLIENLPLPFWTVAGDLVSGREVVFGSGPLAEALDATSAIPAVFPPVRIGKRVLVDGWVINPLPADVLRREGAELVIAVDASDYHQPVLDWEAPRWRMSRFTNPAMVRITLRAIEVSAHERTLASLASVDACVQPDVGGFSPIDFRPMETIVERGERAAEQALAHLREVIASGNT